jgi:hypothetical protein
MSQQYANIAWNIPESLHPIHPSIVFYSIYKYVIVLCLQIVYGKYIITNAAMVHFYNDGWLMFVNLLYVEL